MPRVSFASTLFASSVAIAACSGAGDSTSPERAATGPEAGAPGAADGGPEDGAPGPTADSGAADAGPSYGCTGAVATCTCYDELSHCVPSPTGGTWVKETCPAGCYQGQCSATACADECVLGEAVGGKTCRLWDLQTHAFVAPDPAGTLHDRARDYDRILRATGLPEGQVMNARFTDTSLTKVAAYAGYHDAAIWTGSALAAQAWRYLATGEPVAASELDSLARTLHTNFAVSGDPGYLARAVLATGGTTPLDTANRCADPEWHCGVALGGKTVDWLGATSRDQYTGVMLGFYAAYLATHDEALRSLLRDDIVRVATELVKVRPAVPATIVVDGLPIQKTLALENVILAPSDVASGRVQITLSTSSPQDAQITGMREFFPDYAPFVAQVLGLNVPIPRPSSAIMLGAILQMALYVTDGVPGQEATHQAIATYYAAHAPAWLGIAAGWSFSASCGNGYFANHITFVMAHAYAMLEKDPVLLPKIRDDVLDRAMWTALKGHKNPYFAFLWGATRPSPGNAELGDATAQLAQFSPGPRVHVARDATAAPAYMPHDTTCTSPVLCDTATLAVDVKDRKVDDFLWQRQPWQLQDSGDKVEVYPGVDYLAAYWAGRNFGYVAEDRPGTCARYAP